VPCSAYAFAGRSSIGSLPPGPGPHPAIVALHGASDGSRHFFLFRHLAEVLPRVGISVLRYDRQGKNVAFDDQVSHAIDAIEALSAHSDIDRERIGLWGFSQGAWIASLVVAQGTDVRALVLVSAAGVSPVAQMRYGTTFHLQRAGFDDKAVERMLHLRHAVEQYNRGESDRATAQSTVDAAADEPWFELAYVRRTLPEQSGWWPDADFDPEPVFAAVRIPVLLLYGETDEWIPIDESIATWQRVLRRSGSALVTIVRIPGTAHHPTLGGRLDETAIAPEYSRVLVDWLRAHLAQA